MTQNPVSGAAAAPALKVDITDPILRAQLQSALDDLPRQTELLAREENLSQHQALSRLIRRISEYASWAQSVEEARVSCRAEIQDLEEDKAYMLRRYSLLRQLNDATVTRARKAWSNEALAREMVTIEGLRDELQRAESRLQATDANVPELRESLRVAQESARQAKRKFDEQLQQLTDLSDAANRLETKNEELRNRAEDLERSLEAEARVVIMRDDTISQLQNELGAAAQTLADRNRSVAHLSERETMLQNSLEAKNEQLRQQSQRYTLASELRPQTSAGKSTPTLKRMSKRHRIASNNVEDQRSAFRKLRAELDSIEQEIDKLFALLDHDEQLAAPSKRKSLVPRIVFVMQRVGTKLAQLKAHNAQLLAAGVECSPYKTRLHEIRDFLRTSMGLTLDDEADFNAKLFELLRAAVAQNRETAASEQPQQQQQPVDEAATGIEHNLDFLELDKILGTPVVQSDDASPQQPQQVWGPLALQQNAWDELSSSTAPDTPISADESATEASGALDKTFQELPSSPGTPVNSPVGRMTKKSSFRETPYARTGASTSQSKNPEPLIDFWTGSFGYPPPLDGQMPAPSTAQQPPPQQVSLLGESGVSLQVRPDASSDAQQLPPSSNSRRRKLLPDVTGASPSESAERVSSTGTIPKQRVQTVHVNANQVGSQDTNIEPHNTRVLIVEKKTNEW